MRLRACSATIKNTVQRVRTGIIVDVGQAKGVRSYFVRVIRKSQGQSIVDLCIRALRAHFGAGHVPVLALLLPDGSWRWP